jgi:DNA-binding response OmpR family regulator
MERARRVIDHLGMAYVPADPPYVLVVEDDAAIREALGQTLYDDGFVPLLASCGEEAVDFMNGASAPVLVVLDFGLPGMPSAELLARFKADANWASVPVLLISGNPKADIPGDMPVDEFLQKPFDVDALLRFAHGAVGAR